MLRKQPAAFKAGLFILISIALIGIFAPYLAPYSPFEMGIPYLHPSSEHLLGTNDVGQDILSELIYGTRVSLIISVVSAFVVTVIGTSVGVLSGYLGGWWDKILMELTAVAQAIPSLPVTVVLVAFLSANIWTIIIAICITSWSTTARIIRSRVLQLKELPFIKIEQTMGASHGYIMFHHVLPNVIDIIFVQGVLSVGNAMVTEASLSFLGLGVLGQKSWGGILHYAFFRNGLINGCWWWYLPPIICISVSVLGFMLLSYVRKGK